MSATRKVAERIAADLGYQGGWQNQQALTETIDQALQAERERCAKIAESHEGHGDWCSSAAGDCQSLTVKAVAAAIREGEPLE